MSYVKHPYNSGDKVRLVRRTGWMFLNNKPLGTEFTVRAIIDGGDKYPEQRGHFYVQIEEGWSEYPGHSQPLSAFELSQPDPRREEVVRLGKANMRKRIHIRLLEEQNAKLRAELKSARERNAAYIRSLGIAIRVRRFKDTLIKALTFNHPANAPDVSVNTPGPFAHTVSAIQSASMVAQQRQDVYAGHAAQGGLQNHSIGDEYPYIVQGYQAGPTAEVVWKIKDAETGNVAAATFSTSAEASRTARFWKRVDNDQYRSGDGPRTKIGKNGKFTLIKQEEL